LASAFMVRQATGTRLRRPPNDGNTKRMISYGLPLAATGLAGTLGYQFDRIVVGVNFSPREFAVYALGAVEIPLGMLIAAAVSNVLVPRLTILWRDGDRVGMVAVWREAMRKTSLVLLPMFAFMTVMSADLVRLLYGAGYSESVAVFRVYLFLLPLRIATWGLIPQAIGKTGINLQASLLILVSNVVIAPALVGPLGLIGPALAAPLSAAIAATYYLVRLRSIAGLAGRDLVPVRALTHTLAVSMLAAAPLLAIHEIPLPTSIRLVAAAGTFGVIAASGLRVTRTISDSDWDRLREAVARLRRRTAHGT
jgi:O-antigen/teichoic acid export membrane protein